MFLAQRPSIISHIYRCYILWDRPAATPRYRAVFGRLEPGLCRISYVNFAEFAFHALR